MCESMLLIITGGTALQAGGSRVRFMPIPVAEQSKTRVCGRSLAGVAGSNFSGGLDVCVVFYE